MNACSSNMCCSGITCISLISMGSMKKVKFFYFRYQHFFKTWNSVTAFFPFVSLLMTRCHTILVAQKLCSLAKPIYLSTSFSMNTNYFRMLSSDVILKKTSFSLAALYFHIRSVNDYIKDSLNESFVFLHLKSKWVLTHSLLFGGSGLNQDHSLWLLYNP